MHILINSTSNFQSAIFYRNTAKRTKSFHQIPAGRSRLTTFSGTERCKRKSGCNDEESLFIYTTVYLFTYPFVLWPPHVPVLLVPPGSLVPLFPWVAWIVVGSVAGCWVCRKANWNVYPCTYRNCRNKCCTREDRDMSKVFCKRACRHHPGWYFRRGMYLVVPEYSLVCNWELIAYYFILVVEFYPFLQYLN